MSSGAKPARVAILGDLRRSTGEKCFVTKPESLSIYPFTISTALLTNLSEALAPVLKLSLVLQRDALRFSMSAPLFLGIFSSVATSAQYRFHGNAMANNFKKKQSITLTHQFQRA
jgi:hypothetical protein